MIQIHYATLEETDKIAEIRNSSWQAAYRGIVPDQILDNLDPQDTSKRLKSEISKFPQQCGIAYKDKVPVGFICFGRSRDPGSLATDGEIYAIYLHPEFLNQGIGSKLVEWGENELKQKGYQRISIWVLEDNLNARNFYEKHLYRFDGAKNELMIGKPLIEIRYLKVLNSS